MLVPAVASRFNSEHQRLGHGYRHLRPLKLGLGRGHGGRGGDGYQQLARPFRQAARDLADCGYRFPVGPLAQVLQFCGDQQRCGGEPVPRVLLLVGAPGTGKTTLIEMVSRVAGIRTIRFSLADTESSHAGQPADRLRAAAWEAERLERQGHRVAIVMDDAELGIGSPRDGDGSSTNRPQLQGVLQELADGRHAVNGEVIGPKTFMFSGNDASSHLTSLIRESRCVVIEYDPTDSEKAEIAQTLFCRVMPPQLLGRRLGQLSRLSVAEIVAVRAGVRQHVERLLIGDMTYEQYKKWLGSPRHRELIDAVARRVLCDGDIRSELRAIQARAQARRSFL